jgi:hypothetical protein
MTGAEPISDVDLATAPAPLAVEALEAAAPLVAPLAQSVSMIAAAPMADLAGEVHVFLTSVLDLLAKYSLPTFVPMHFSAVRGSPETRVCDAATAFWGLHTLDHAVTGRAGLDLMCTACYLRSEHRFCSLPFQISRLNLLCQGDQM